MTIARRLSRRLLSASLRAMLLPGRRGSLIRRLWVAAAVLGPAIYLGGRGRVSLRLLAARKEDPGKSLEWQW